MNHAALLVSTAALFFVSAQSHADDSTAPLAHVRNSFDFLVHASYRDTAPLFGPHAERAWAGGHWNPQFVYPQPAADIPGAVFSIQHGPLTAVWVNTAFDLDARHVQYVYFIPETLVTTIDLNFNPVDSANTKVNVTYTRTALSRSANEHVESLGAQDRANGPYWEKDINAYLKTRKP